MIPSNPSEFSSSYVLFGVVEEYESSDDQDSDIDEGPDQPISPGGLSLRRDAAAVPAQAAALPREMATKLSLNNAASGRDGIVWHARIFPDEFNNAKHVTPGGDLKLRRPLPQASPQLFAVADPN